MRTLSWLCRIAVCAGTLAVLGAIDAQAYRPPVSYIVPLTPLFVEKFLACAPAVFKLNDRFDRQIGVGGPITRSQATKRRKKLSADKMKALGRCGFPDQPHAFEDVGYSIDLAAGLEENPLHAGTFDKDGKFIAEDKEAAEARTRAANVLVVAPYKAKLTRLHARRK